MDKFRYRRRWMWGITLLMAVSAAWAQEGPSAADLKRMYDDVVSQLKSAQDRKNELAGENDKLQHRVVDLEKRLQALEAQNAELEHTAADYAQNTYQFRANHAAWEIFLKHHPETKAGWERFLGTTAFTPKSPADWLNLNWPLAP